MKNIFTDHPRDTENPQGYWQHGKFGFINSCKMILAGILGIIHAVFPWWFKFSTSSAIIKSFKTLVDSRRHLDELNQIMPKNYLNKKHLTRKN
jgi:hypothetical protein